MLPNFHNCQPHPIASVELLTMSFCWSVGDIISACLLVHEVVKALDDSRGSAKYQDLVNELHNLNRALLETEILSRRLESTPELNALAATTNKVARDCAETLEGFLEKLKNSRPVGLDPSKAKRPPGLIQRIQFRLSSTEEVSKVR
jgi:hypothetical protein